MCSAHVQRAGARRCASLTHPRNRHIGPRVPIATDRPGASPCSGACPSSPGACNAKPTCLTPSFLGPGMPPALRPLFLEAFLDMHHPLGLGSQLGPRGVLTAHSPAFTPGRVSRPTTQVPPRAAGWDLPRMPCWGRVCRVVHPSSPLLIGWAGGRPWCVPEPSSCRPRAIGKAIAFMSDLEAKWTPDGPGKDMCVTCAWDTCECT